jgi:hypothetical protein
MPNFEVRRSSRGANAFESAPASVDIGISSDARRREQSGILVTAERLGSEPAIDHAIDQLVAEIEALRPKAKALLGTLK